MKKLNITKEAFEKSNYFKNKYGRLEYVSESGKLFKTNKGRILKFKESSRKFGKKFTKESMNWNGVTDKFIDNDTVQFTRKCPSCGKPHSIIVSIRDVEDGMSEYGKGARIQDAFPNLTPDEREFFMSGLCDKCWEEM